ncbi:hypothetical protein JCM16358_16920 [Halanaerocella petrolearia]
MYNKIENQISQRKALNIIDKLYEEEVISLYERDLFYTILCRKTIDLNTTSCKLLRARLLKGILKSLIRKGE